MEGAAYLDARTGSLYFGGSEGIDCFVADSLEPKLRSGVRHLWLEEEKEVVTLKKDEEPLSTWWQWSTAVVVLCGVTCAVAVLILWRRRRKTVAEKKEAVVKVQPVSPVTESTDSPVEAEAVEEYVSQEPAAQELSPFVARATEFVNAYRTDCRNDGTRNGHEPFQTLRVDEAGDRKGRYGICARPASGVCSAPS